VRAPIPVYANAPWRKKRVLAIEDGSIVHKELKEQLRTTVKVDINASFFRISLFVNSSPTSRTTIRSTKRTPRRHRTSVLNAHSYGRIFDHRDNRANDNTASLTRRHIGRFATVHGEISESQDPNRQITAHLCQKEACLRLNFRTSSLGFYPGRPEIPVEGVLSWVKGCQVRSRAVGEL
jgi:hypothetical protein